MRSIVVSLMITAVLMLGVSTLGTACSSQSSGSTFTLSGSGTSE